MRLIEAAEQFKHVTGDTPKNISLQEALSEFDNANEDMPNNVFQISSKQIEKENISRNEQPE